MNTGLVLELQPKLFDASHGQNAIRLSEQQNGDSQVFRYRSLALFDRDEADDVSSLLSSSEKEDIDEHLCGLADDFIRSEDLDIDLAILDGIGGDNNQDQCHLPTSR